MYDLSIVLCTINEADNLPEVLKIIDEKVNANYQIVFVDDESTDGTREFILEYEKKHSNVKHIFNETRKSTLIAHYMGFKNSDGKFIIILDADLQHPPEKINEIYQKLVYGYDIVVASRYTESSAITKRNFYRFLLSRGAEIIAKMAIKSTSKTSDPLSGFFGFKRDINVPVDEKRRGYKFLLLLLAANPYAKVTDIPYIFSERKRGKSKVAKGIKFMFVYLNEVLYAKSIENKFKKK